MARREVTGRKRLETLAPEVAPEVLAARPGVTRRELAQLLTALGFPIKKSTLDKLSMRERGEGPPSKGTWGNREIYDPRKGISWAEQRFRRKAAPDDSRQPGTADSRITNSP